MNLRENFWGLGRSTNGSKSAQNHDDWTHFKGDELTEEQRALLAQKDKVARAALARKLKAMLAKKKKC